MKRREFIGLLGAVLTVRPQDGAAQSATIRRNVAMTESSTVKNLGAVFDAHVKAEFIDKDVSATMATMVAEPYLTHVPTLTGGTGRSEVESFYRDHFVGHWPDDVEVKPLSRTVGQNRVVDELIVSFTHDREMRVFLPGVPPTGRKVVLPHVVVMGFDEAGRVAYEHIYWDQASLLVQVGLLDPALLPVSGAEQAKRPARQHTACKRDDRTVAIESEAAVASFFAHLLPTRVICVRFHERDLTHLGEPANQWAPWRDLGSMGHRSPAYSRAWRSATWSSALPDS